MIKTKYYSWCSKDTKKIAKGCKQCVRGEKLVLFITGICPRNCFYCPISDEKSKHDVIFANERPVKKFSEVIDEAKMCNSKGAGVTGGDPLARISRTVKYIVGLKKEFGKKFHIHLYTSYDLVNSENLKKLYDAGLDEIRFHPDLDDDKLWGRIDEALKFDWDVGVEIPVIPGKLDGTKKLLQFLNGKVKFVNLNELEMSDGKANSLSELGYVPKNFLSYGAAGSDEMAKKLLKFGKKFTYIIHYCTAKLKDRVQLSKRIKKRAKNAAEVFDVIREDGMLQRGAIYCKKGQEKDVVAQLKEYEVPSELYKVEKCRIVTNVGVVMNLDFSKWKPAIVTEYPTWDKLVVELEWV